MIHVRKSWLALLALAVAWIAPAGAAPPVALRAAGSYADRWIVDDADFVLVVNVKQLATADLMKNGGIDILKGMLKSHEQAHAIIEATGLQPFRDIDSILISGNVGRKTSDARGLVVVHGRFDPDKAIAIARKKTDVEVLKEDRIEVIKLKVQDQYAYSAFLDRTTLVVTQSKASTVKWIKNGGKKPARIGATLEKALGQFKGTESLTFALAVNEDLKKLISKVPQLAVAGSRLQTLTAGFTITDSAEVKITGSTSDERATRQLQNAVTVLKGVAEVMLQGDETAFNKKAGDLLSQVKVSSDRDGVHITCKLSKEQLEKVSK